MRLAGLFAVLVIGCSSAKDERTPVTPVSGCVEQVEVARFTGTYDARTDADTDDPREATSITVATPDAPRARKLLAAHGIPVVDANRASSTQPSAGLRAACDARR